MCQYTSISLSIIGMKIIKHNASIVSKISRMWSQFHNLVHLKKDSCSHYYVLYNKNFGGEKTLTNYSNSPSFITNFYYFHNIPYANGLQFTKVFSAKLPTILMCQTFYCQTFYYTVLTIIQLITT